MSNLRPGVLRAVRLLPDVVKIGIEPETALPFKAVDSSSQKEEQLSNEADSSLLDNEGAVAVHDPQKELNNKIEELQAQLARIEAEKLSLEAKSVSLEADLAKVNDAAIRKERELTASIEAAREQARIEGRTQGHAEGLDNGHKSGLDKAYAEVEAQYKEKFSALAAMLEGVSVRLEEHFAELTAMNQPRMLRLWQEMLKKMLQREMELAPDAVLDVLSDVLSRLSDKNHILIYVSPEDMELLQDSLQGEFADVLRGVKHLEVKPDANVDKGSCLVETNLGVYDARWRTQLDQIESAIEKLFQKLGKTPKPKVVRTRRKEDDSRSEPSKSAKSAPKTPVKAPSRKKKTADADA